MLRTCGAKVCWSSSPPNVAARLRWISSNNAAHYCTRAKNVQRFGYQMLPPQGSISNTMALSTMRRPPRLLQGLPPSQAGSRRRYLWSSPAASGTGGISRRALVRISTKNRGTTLVVLGCSVAFGWTGWAWLDLPVVSTIETIDCEAAIIPRSIETTHCESGSVRMRDSSDDENANLLFQLKRALRVIRRLFKLTIVFSPVVALYPLHWITRRIRRLMLSAANPDDEVVTDVHHQPMSQADLDDGGESNNMAINWYYRLCLYCVEYSGAACIKMMQWAGSRPDLFGREFCAVFSKLQDSTMPHSWKHTQQAMIDAFGKDWEEKIQLGEILGSGCIAQVYKGTVVVADSDSDDSGTSTSTRRQTVAVKVMHPNVEDDIDADLDIMRLSIRLLEDFGFAKDLKWLNLPGFIEEMAIMLKTQLDLRKEGANLVQFNKNFEGNPTIIFPTLIDGYPPTKRVLCETYHDGVKLMDFVRNNKADQKLLTHMCKEAIKGVCQMIFLDNFTHGDLHPGNVLVTDDYKFVVLDVGITSVHSEADHRLVSDVLASFIRKDGRKAAGYMIDSSNTMLKSTGDKAINEEEFTRKIEAITIEASGKNYLMQKLGTYISVICNAASTHHVMLNQAFISSALAVKVQEGIALALDPTVELPKVAIPIILEGERRAGRMGERAKEFLPTMDDITYWVTGKKIIRYNVFSDDDAKGKDRVVVYAPSNE